jgi:hypothetical protein
MNIVRFLGTVCRLRAAASLICVVYINRCPNALLFKTGALKLVSNLLVHFSYCTINSDLPIPSLKVFSTDYCSTAMPRASYVDMLTFRVSLHASSWMLHFKQSGTTHFFGSG